MKFLNGFWLQGKGLGILSPTYVEDCFERNNTLYLYAPVRGFDGAMLTLLISSPKEEVIRVQAYHYMGVNDQNDPHFSLNLENSSLQYEENEEQIVVHSGSLSLAINKKNFSMHYYANGKFLTKSTKNNLAYVKENYQGDYYSYDDTNCFMKQELSLSVGELVYGFGEQFTPLVKNGQMVEIWNKDGGTNTEQAYKNVPFYMTNRGYGVFVNSTDRVEFEVGSENVERVQFSLPGQSLDYFLINGPTMKDVLQRYTDLTGKPALPPAWSFGLWLSTSFMTSYDEKTVLSFINKMEENEIPLSVFHFDCNWMKQRHWTDFLWDAKTFPDPKGLIEKIHAKGIKVCVWINPYVAQQSRLFTQGKEKGYFLKRKNGNVWQWDMWQPGLAIVDFTNPEACAWYKKYLVELLEMGVDCFKTDFGERIPTDVTYYNQAPPEKMHNYYTYLFNNLIFQTIQEIKGKEEAVVFARSATAGCQKFPVHWGGDCSASYESMAESLRGGLSFTSSGFGFWSHDIGGFEDTTPPDLYKRWCAFGLLSTHSRLHGNTSYRVPWHYGQEAVEVLRHFTKVKWDLMPYILEQAQKTSKTGIPLMRSMVLEFPEDPNCRYLDQQYMLGDSYLVAPIFNEEGIGSFYLPEGEWEEYFSKEKVTGGKWITKHYDYFHIPLYKKMGA
ncbi:MAG: alpha-xylosidase [Bacillota bacterium]|nr:alpha-xylosidase [Bacillota bacterium]